MWLFLEVLSGEQSGEKYPLREGSRLGRTTGDIILNDKKISSLHAQIEREASGNLALVDKGSSNGIVMNGEKVSRVVMMPGVTFRLGKTNFKVVAGDSLAIAAANTAAGANRPEAPPVASAKPANSWQKALAESLPLMISQNGDPVPNLGPFNPAIKLEFMTGPQTEKVVVLGYGPRKFGAASLDIELEDSAAPFSAFEISPEAGDARISTKEVAVRLNGRSFTSDLLKNGDTVQFGVTEIRVSFIK